MAGSEYLSALSKGEITDADAARALNRDGLYDADVAGLYEQNREAYISGPKSCLPPLGFEFKGKRYDFNTTMVCEIADFVRVMLHLLAYTSVLGIMNRAFGK